MATWRELITDAFAEGDTWDTVVSCTLSSDGLDKEFEEGFGAIEGAAFTLWTAKRVYFPVCYDGAEWVGSVSREPDGVATAHVGGG